MTKQNESLTQTPPLEQGDVGTNVQPPATAGGTDMTQLQTENTNLKAAIRLSEARQLLTAALATAGALSPELLFDAIKGELKFTETGKVENPRALIEGITTRFPEQFGYEQPASIDGGAGTGGGNTLTREALTKMKPAEIARLDWTDVKRVLAGG